MIPTSPTADLATHDVQNMPPYLGDQDLYLGDAALCEGIERESASWALDSLATVGRVAGAVDTFEKADQANANPPQLKAFDRYGMRINQVQFHPAYHDLMSLMIKHEVPSFPWRHPRPGAQVAYAAMTYMFSQAEGGAMCPMAMTYAAIPALQQTASIGNDWIDRLLSTDYDSRDIPVTQKTGATIGMFMTEKQGGSDVRSNSTSAVPLGSQTGPGAAYLLTGHKYFCSAPMCDAFLALAKTDAGVSCFLMPRFKPDGSRNNLMIQRIKDKLGNRSNASTEIEFSDTWALMLGEDGRGIPTIIEMVKGTRFYCCASSAGMMRQGVVQAGHHTRHRSAFGKKLIDQPLMQNVLADLALEAEAALALTLRLGRAIDESDGDESAAALARIGTAIGKYWVCKRGPGHAFEALECHGGPGYIEDSLMARIYRETPLNSIWEGSGNVICLDVLRAISRDAATVDALMVEFHGARGQDKRLDRAIEQLQTELQVTDELPMRARRLTEMMALVWQASLLVQHAPPFVADAFCASRLAGQWSGAYGTLPATVDCAKVIARAVPA